MSGPKRRKDDLLNAYKRIKHVFKNDSAITYRQMSLRFGVGYEKLKELRDEVIADANKAA